MHIFLVYTIILFEYIYKTILIYIYIYIYILDVPKSIISPFMNVYIYIYTFINGEMIDFGTSEKMAKIRGKVDKSNTYDGFSNDISSFIHGKTSSD